MGLARKIQNAWNGEFNFDKYFSGREKYQHSRNPLARLWYGHYCARENNRWCASIPLPLKLPRSVQFPHGISGIYISVGARIGEGCVIFQQVTIGSNTLEGSSRQGSPTIGKNVFIGAGAKIVGGITVGDNVRIGAGCVVARDIPENATVVAAPVRIIERAEARVNEFNAVRKTAED